MATSQLAKDHIGTTEVVFQSASFLAPSFSVVAGLTAAALYGGGSISLAVIIAWAAALIGANTLFQFQRKISSAGGYYTYVARSSGPGAGLITGWVYVLFQAVNPATIMLFFGYFIQQVIQMGLHVHMASWSWLPFSVAAGLFAWGLAYLGIKPSLRYSAVATILEVVVFLILGIVLISSPGAHNSLAAFTPSISPTGWHGVGLAAVWGYFIFVGYGGSAPLGEEAKNPHRTISRAVIITLLGIGVFYVFMAYASTIGFGIHHMATYASLPLPLLTLAISHLGMVWFWIIVVLTGNSMLACTTAQLNAQVRVLFSLGRDKLIVPAALGTTHPRYKTPATAIHVQSILSLILVVAVGFWIGPFNALVLLGTIVTLGNLVVHIIANYSLTKYFRKLGQLRWLTHIVFPVVASLTYLRQKSPAS